MSHINLVLPADAAQAHTILRLGHFAFLNSLCLWTLHFLPADRNHWDTCDEQQTLHLVQNLGGCGRRQILAIASCYEILA